MISAQIPLYSPSPEEKRKLLLKWFGENFDGFGMESQHSLGKLSHYCVSFFNNEKNGPQLAGHGSDRHRDKATIKGVCEWIERKVAKHYFDNSSSILFSRFSDNFKMILQPSTFRTTNGWAVHFDADLSREKAYEEALERHILIASYLKSGWTGFKLIDEQKLDGRRIYSIVSRYSCMGYRSGMVILKDDTFPGICFGYLCEKESKILVSPKWEHALFEALNFSERIKMDKNKSYDGEINPIASAIKDWLYTPWNTPNFSSQSDVTLELPEIDPFVLNYSVKDVLGVDLGIYASHVFGGGLIPLFFPKHLTPQSKTELLPVLKKIGAEINESLRLPVV